MQGYVLFLTLRDSMCSPLDDAKAADGVLVSSAGGKKKVWSDHHRLATRKIYNRDSRSCAGLTVNGTADDSG